MFQQPKHTDIVTLRFRLELKLSTVVTRDHLVPSQFSVL